MKVLSMTNRRLQDRIDVQCLLQSAAVDLDRVREDLALIAARGYDRDEDLGEKLGRLLAALAS